MIFICCLLPRLGSVLHQISEKHSTKTFVRVITLSETRLAKQIFHILHLDLILFARLSIGVMSIRCFILVLRAPYCGYINLNRSYKDRVGTQVFFCFAYLLCDNPSELTEYSV